MSVLDRSELQASPLADLHAIADQLGLDGFRRQRKADLIDLIVTSQGGAGSGASEAPELDAEPAPARARARRGRASAAPRSADAADAADEPRDAPAAETDEGRPAPRRASARRRRTPRSEQGASAEATSAEPDAPRADAEDRAASPAPSRRERGAPVEQERSAEGVVELLGNGSAFVRVNPPEPSDEDVYVSAAQVRRCELVSGDRVSGPVRAPRRSERYPSLLRVDTINGAAAESVSQGTHYDDLPAAFPAERLAVGGEDPTLQAIELLTPLGRGSRAVIVGGAGAGKTEALRRLAQALHGQEEMEVSLVLSGVRPEEIGEWQAGPLAPAAALSFAAPSDALVAAVERAVETARRVAARGADAVVLIDSLDGLPPAVARRALAAARNIVDGGSLTVIATASRPLGGETTVIALDAALTRAGRLPALDLTASATLRAELLVGEEGALAIAHARASAQEAHA